TDNKDIGADIDAIEAAISGSNLPPTQPLTVTISASTTTGTDPLPVTFTCNVSSTTVQVVSYYWDFGDNQTASSQQATRTYMTGGTYTVSLIVTDASGATGVGFITLNVVNTPAPPVTAPEVVLYAASAAA